MKRTIKLAVAAAVALTSTAAFATNGDNLIGLGAKSRAMGGTGIAHYNGSESATSNPALITKGKGTQFTFGGTYFTPDVHVSTTAGNVNNPAVGTSADSEAKHNVIPYVVLTENLDNGFAVGMSMYGSAGMGTDWRNGDVEPGLGMAGLYNMRSNLMLLKFSIPVAYGQDNWSVGLAPVLMYGSMDMSFDNQARGVADSYDVGNGSSSSFGMGAELGAAYTLPDMGLTIGAVYHSSIEMEYKDQISTTASAFGYNNPGQLSFNDKLEQPAEYGFGIDWTTGDLSLTFDWKKVLWADARGYSDFGWENQNVYAVGAEYKMDKLALRAGYNYGKNPLNTLENDNGRMNTLNHVMFPAVTDRHYTVGAGYQFTKNVGADIAVTYATSQDVKVDATGVGLGEITVTNDQKSLSANLNYMF